MLRRYLAPVLLLLLGAVAPATSDLAQRQAQVAESADELFLYRSRAGDTLASIRDEWLLPVADLRRLQLMNGMAADSRIPAGTDIRIPLPWVKTMALTATVAAFRGDVRVIRDGEIRPAARGFELREGDEIETGPNGFVTLALPDESRVSLPSASRVAVERLRQVLLTDSLDRRFTLRHGQSDMKVTPMANPASRFLITTPVAVAAVRGTEYRVEFTPADMRAVTEVTEGRVLVRLVDGSAEVLVEAGFAAVATPSGLGGPLALPGRPLVAVRNRAQTEKDVIFRLKPVPGIAGYRVELAADAGFADRVASAETASGEVLFRDLANGHYYARAYLVSAEGLRGVPAVFEFDRRYTPARTARTEETEESAPMPQLADPAPFLRADGPWFSGAGGGGGGGDAIGPVVAAGDADGLRELAEEGESASGGASPLLARLQPFAAFAPGGVSGGGFPGGGVSGGGGGALSPGRPLPLDSGPSNSGPSDTGQSGGSIPSAGASAVVPEPRVWLLLLTGFGLVGWTMRSRRRFA